MTRRTPAKAKTTTAADALAALALERGGSVRRVDIQIPRSKSGPCLLSLDVSSSATGWAAFHGDRLADFGVIRPRAKLPALERVDLIVAGVEGVLDAAYPDYVCMEISGGKTHGRLARATGLSVLGHAQGECRRAILNRNLPVEAITENEWTCGRKKCDRARTMAVLYPAYGTFLASGRDAGLDAADAIGLAEFYFARKRERQLIERHAKGAGR